MPSEGTRLSAPDRQLLAVLWLGLFVVSLDVSALAIALPGIASDMGTGLSATSWASLAYLLTMAGMTLPTGRLLDNYGHRAVLCVGFIVFAAASLGCALSRDIVVLSGFRLVQGVGAAALYVSGAAVIRAQLPDEVQGRAFAVLTTAGSAGMCLGPAMGGFVTAQLGWPWIFLFNLPVAAIGLLLLARLPSIRPDTSRARFDYVGSVLAFITLLGIVFALNQGRELGWLSPAILGSFATAACVALWLVRRELRVEAPALDVRLFMVPGYGLGSIGVFVFLLVVAGFLFLLPFDLQWFRGLSADQAGLMYLLHPVAMVLASLALARFMSPGRSWLFYLCGVLLIGGSLLMFSLFSQGTALWAIGLALVCFGLGYGAYFPTTQSQIMAAAPAEESGRAAAANAVVRVVAQLLGVVVFETIFSQRYALPSSPHYGSIAMPDALATMSAAFSLAFGVAALVVLLALCPMLAARWKNRTIQP